MSTSPICACRALVHRPYATDRIAALPAPVCIVPVSDRSRTRRRIQRLLCWSAPHAGSGGPGLVLGSRPGAEKILAGLEVTAKSVERTAEAVGTHIDQCEQNEIRKIVQLDLPIIV